MYTSVEPAKLSANALRRLAEKADGLRDKHPFLVVDDNDIVDVAAETDIKGRHKLLDLTTLNDGPGLNSKPILGMTVDGKPYPEGTELDVADAIFTSQSAVEKFVFPYYTRVEPPRNLRKWPKTCLATKKTSPSFTTRPRFMEF